MSDGIKGFKAHPNSLLLVDYRDKPTESSLTVRLDYLAWGNSTNLFCYFTDLNSGKKYTLSVFADKRYIPSKGGCCFRDTSLLGRTFDIVLDISGDGRAKFLNATLLNDIKTD